MTRIEKIVSIKNSNADDIKTINLHECRNDEIDRLHTIAVNQTKGIGRSVEDWQFINKVKAKPGNYKSVGKFS
jgi:hypothetical protein